MMRGTQAFLAGALLAATVLAAGCASGAGYAQAQPTVPIAKRSFPKNAKTLVFGGGCFWCVEAIFEPLKGVLDVESGYAGGESPNVSYEEVSMGYTGHAEVVKVTYDPDAVSADDLLRIFFTTHDPTQLNRQGPDYGTQYRSVIFYSTPEEKTQAIKIRDEVVSAKLYPRRVVTTIEPLKNYTRAEEYHQDYFAKYERATPQQRATMNAGYCQNIVAPKVRKFREKYASKLRKDG